MTDRLKGIARFLPRQRPITERPGPSLYVLMKPSESDEITQAESMLRGGVNKWRRYEIDSQAGNTAIYYPGTFIEEHEEFGIQSIGSLSRSEIWQLAHRLQKNEREIDSLSGEVKAKRLLDEAARLGLPEAVRGLLTARLNLYGIYDADETRKRLQEAYEAKIQDLEARSSTYDLPGRRWTEARADKRKIKDIQSEIRECKEELAAIKEAI